MKGYAKIKENNPFSQKSKSKKEHSFLDQDFNDQGLDGHLDIYSSNLPTKKPQGNEQKPNFIVKDDNNKIKSDLFLGTTKEYDDDQHHEKKHEVENGGEKKMEGVLRRNFSVSSSKTSFGYQKNGKSCNLERQSSTRVIQEKVKRAFSMRRSSSVNSDRYCRIYDQPKNVEDCDSNYDYVYDYGNNGTFNNGDNDDDFERSGSMETTSMGLKKKNKDDYSKNGKVNVGSKVVKACKRLFSR